MQAIKTNESCLNLERSIYFFHAAPLGSIPELPAESCNEIKASEGNEMVNKDYWIYSDENASNAILARCEGAVFTLRHIISSLC